MAYSSAFRALRQASKCAYWEIGPHPRTPTRSNRGSFFIADWTDNAAGGLRATVSIFGFPQGGLTRGGAARGKRPSTGLIGGFRGPGPLLRRRILDPVCLQNF